jgi:hypothetical protein
MISVKRPSTYIYICMYMCIHIYIYIMNELLNLNLNKNWLYMSIYLYMRVCYLFTHLFVYLCIHISLYIYRNIFIDLYIYIYIYCRTVPSVTGKGSAIRNRRANPCATLTLCAENACSLCLNRECLTRQGTYQFLLLGILARVQPAILSIIN